MITNEVQIEHFGIDFGTTNIAVGGLIVDKETKRAFRVLYGEDGVPFPSIVAVKYDFEKGKPVGRFGRKVKTQISSMQDDGYQIIKSIKTALGDETAIYEIGPEKLSSTKVVTVLIKAIKRHLQTQLQRKVEIKNATVAVPVDFSNKQKGRGGARPGSGRKATGRKTKCLTITLTEEQAEVLQEKAKYAHLTVSQFIVKELDLPYKTEEKKALNREKTRKKKMLWISLS